MLDDYKYSIGRLVVYRHSEPKLPRQSYGHYGHERTVGEIIAVDLVRHPKPHWLYSIRNVRNNEVARVTEDNIKFATSALGRWTKGSRPNRVEDGALAEMIAKALSSPESDSLLRSTLREFLRKEELAARVLREGAKLPLQAGDYIRIRGDLRKETEPLHNQYAKILSVEPADVAGIENPSPKPGQPPMLRTHKVYEVVSPEGVRARVYDAEVKLFYTANGRRTLLNWRAATLLAESFNDPPPYNVDLDHAAEHVFTRDELQDVRRSELVQILASILYAKGKIGLRDYQRRGHMFSAAPKSHLIDAILELSRFDARRNRAMSAEEIAAKKREYSRLSRLLA